MKQFKVTGMTCAACSARVEKAVKTVRGVESCTVNLLTGDMSVSGDFSDNDVVASVTAAGYGISEKSKNESKNNDEFNETNILKKRLVWSLIFLVLLMYFSMGHSMLGFPVPNFLHYNKIALAIIQMLLSLIVLIINKKFFINGFKSAVSLSPNMDTLVSLGSGVSFFYSLYVVFLMTDAAVNGDLLSVANLSHGLYFESAAMILTLITLGKLLESISKGKTTDALKNLFELAPKTANVIRNDTEVTISVEDVVVGDVFVVRPGEQIPVDGVVLEGNTVIDESAISGESVPVEKYDGDNVTSATLNVSGFIKCKALKVGNDTTISKIIQMVNDASVSKAPIAKMADKISGVFVPIVLLIAVVTTIVWLLLDSTVSFAVSRGISVLVISCPCALGLATPVAIMVGNGKGAKNGILFKTAEALEISGRINTVVFDKTGTLTEGKPKVTDVVACEYDTTELLTVAVSLESLSKHPLGLAVVEYCNDINISPLKIDNFENLSGFGIKGELNGEVVYAVSRKYAAEIIDINDETESRFIEFANLGKTPLFIIKNNELLGIIAVADTVKEDSAKSVLELQQMGIDVVMLTGDNRATAESIGKQIGVEHIIADVLPDGKESVIKKLRANKKVAMVGDGINDAPALKTADVGIAIGSGTDIAIDAADVVIMKNNVLDVVAALKLGKATLRIIKQNLFWAFIYNIFGIPLAAGVFIGLFGWELNPMFGAAAMSLSSFCVVSNALRLRYAKLYKVDKTIKKEIVQMTKTFNVDGMMCGHCEAHVKKALEAIDGITLAEPNKDTKTVIVHLNADISDDVIIKAITNEGYKVL